MPDTVRPPSDINGESASTRTTARARCCGRTSSCRCRLPRRSPREDDPHCTHRVPRSIVRLVESLKGWGKEEWGVAERHEVFNGVSPPHHRFNNFQSVHFVSFAACTRTTNLRNRDSDGTSLHYVS